MPRLKNSTLERSPLTRSAGTRPASRRRDSLEYECRREPVPRRGRRQAALWAAVLMIMAGALAPAESRAANAVLSCPGTAMAGQQFTAEVTIDVGSSPLGSYGVTLSYDGTLLTVVSVAGGSTAEFSTTPTNNKNVCSGSSCQTLISGLQTTSLAGPTGVVSVAMVTFGVVASSNTLAPIGLTVRSLFDTGGNAIAITGSVGCTVSVTGPTTTTTTSTTSTTTTSTTTSTLTTTTTQAPAEPPASPTTTTTTPTTTTTTTSTTTSTSTTTTTQ